MADFRKQAIIAQTKLTKFERYLYNAIILIADEMGESLERIEPHICNEIGITSKEYRRLMLIEGGEE